MDLSVGGHSPTLPGLKLPSQQRAWPSGPEGDDAPLVQLPGPSPSPDGSRAASDPLDPSGPGNITIPRPHGRKTPELGSIIALPVCQSRSRPPGAAGGPTSGGREFRQALSKSTEEERARGDASSDDGVDVLSLLDPLSSSAQSRSVSDGGRLALISAPHKAMPPCGPSPQALPPFPLHPQVVLNPFAHGPSKFHFLPSPSANPFAAGLGPRQGPYLHPRPQPPPFPALPGLYRQQAASMAAPPPSGAAQAASSHSLSSLAEPGALPPKPVPAEGHSQSSRDPFEDLLTVGQSASTTTSKVENLQRRWETFE